MEESQTNDLPPEVWAQVLTYLDDIPTLGRVSRVCRLFAHLLQADASNWRELCVERFPLASLPGGDGAPCDYKSTLRDLSGITLPEEWTIYLAAVGQDQIFEGRMNLRPLKSAWRAAAKRCARPLHGDGVGPPGPLDYVAINFGPFYAVSHLYRVEHQDRAVFTHSLQEVDPGRRVLNGQLQTIWGLRGVSRARETSLIQSLSPEERQLEVQALRSSLDPPKSADDRRAEVMSQLEKMLSSFDSKSPNDKQSELDDALVGRWNATLTFDEPDPLPTADKLGSLPIKELKRLIVANRLSHEDCLERSDLVARLCNHKPSCDAALVLSFGLMYNVNALGGQMNLEGRLVSAGDAVFGPGGLLDSKLVGFLKQSMFSFTLLVRQNQSDVPYWLTVISELRGARDTMEGNCLVKHGSDVRFARFRAEKTIDE